MLEPEVPAVGDRRQSLRAPTGPVPWDRVATGPEEWVSAERGRAAASGRSTAPGPASTAGGTSWATPAAASGSAGGASTPPPAPPPAPEPAPPPSPGRPTP